ncbi:MULTISPECIES: antirestriction protein ArdA [Lachnospiraceae]|nr:antirestriction protein ArdA [Hungatella hathewayi]RGO64360.1 antirestriction protein ArdA [Hungatella hathewayi]RHM78094.1 antirestriction protein ArdA [Hungatella hathewayi]
MRIYIANLGKYNEGELVGDWFTPPIDYDEMAERIGLNDRYEEYAIHDYELPFEIDEYTSIEEINRMCEMVEDLPEDIQDELSELVSHFGSIEELYDNQDRIFHYPDCEDMADVAEYFLYESGTMDAVPEELRDYIDFEGYGNNLYTSGTFIETNHGVYEIGW